MCIPTLKISGGVVTAKIPPEYGMVVEDVYPKIPQQIGLIYKMFSNKNVSVWTYSIFELFTKNL